MLKKNFLILFVILVLILISTIIYKNVDSSETKTTIGLFTVTSKGQDIDKWISVTSEDDVTTRLMISNDSTWNEVVVGEKYKIRFTEENDKTELVSIYPEEYSGRLE